MKRSNPIDVFLDSIAELIKNSEPTEHSYRPSLITFLKSSFPTKFDAINEEARVKYGAPDITVRRNNIAIGYLEAKDVDKELSNKLYDEQFSRYKNGLENIIFTNCLDWELYRNNELIICAKIGKYSNKKITLLESGFDNLTELLKLFSEHKEIQIKNADILAEKMSRKALLLKDVFSKIIDEENNTLIVQYNALKKELIHDLDKSDFIDMCSQTVIYGVFVAKLNFKGGKNEDFTRERVARLISVNNRFLSGLFSQFAGLEVDERAEWIIDDIINIIRHADIGKIFGSDNDPFIHFYEDFLRKYDKETRRKRGAYYTPKPIVNFIVRSVDKIIENDYALTNGLINDAKLSSKRLETDIFRLQILDPATGTGAFLTEIINYCYEKFKSKGMAGGWSSWVKDNLLNRVNGFEIMMSPYAISHLNIDLTLARTGYKNDNNNRFHIYLTNSLERGSTEKIQSILAPLSDEINLASRIKNDIPLMIIIGNPPYSGESMNEGIYEDELKEYKKDINGNLIKDTKWVNNDYVKFIKLAQDFINSKELQDGVVAYINPTSYLGSKTFRGMRASLLKDFDKIFIINLHGGENYFSSDGSKDENVFGIKESVCINIFIKNNLKKVGELAEVYYTDIYGSKEQKFKELNKNSCYTLPFDKVELEAPDFRFIPNKIDKEVKETYDKGFKIDDIFLTSGVGIVSKRNDTAFQFNREMMKSVLNDFITLSEDEIRDKYKSEVKESRDKKIVYAVNNIKKYGIQDELIRPILFKPFDIRYTYFTNKSKGFLAFPVYEMMKNYLTEDNYGLVCNERINFDDKKCMFVTNTITNLHLLVSSSQNQNGARNFPLYINDDTGIEEFNQRRHNLNLEIVNIIAEKINMDFVDEKDDTTNNFAPIDILDYIYAILNSDKYYKAYILFLQYDFPKIPYPKDKTYFKKISSFGKELRALHLMQDENIISSVTFDIDGACIVDDVIYENGKVFINKTQYFSNIAEDVWNYKIGAFLPAKGWLNARKTYKLNQNDILTFRKIISSISKTISLIKDIDNIIEP